ncbi:MAG: hypothetical protein JWN48_3850 [Myxococcaceae bacterium]|nr:hypothetical protein [Myxococcaceae bacterium]
MFARSSPRGGLAWYHRGAMRSWLRQSVLWALLYAVATVSPAVAEPAWDGFESLLEVARASDAPLITADVVDLNKLEAHDALLVIGPESPLPTSALTAFLREGGRIALLDDFGSGERLLSAYQVSRSPAPEADVPALRGDPKLLIAYPASEHPLVDGVELLLTNGASALRHRDLKPVFTFGHTDAALVLAGAVGAGRLVAVGDSSVLINQLLAVRSHEQFAKNLLAYLKRPSGKLFLVDARTRFEGSYGGTNARGLSQVDGFLKRVAHPDLPPGVLSLLSLGLCAICAVVIVGSLPRRSPYVRAELLPRASVYAGFAARVALSETDPPNLIWTLLDYRRELLSELSLRLELGAPPTPDSLVQRARERGVPDATVQTLGAILRRLDQVAESADAAVRPPRIRVSELRNVVRQGEELLTRLGNG